jgi:hypothetical protein
LGLFVKKKRQKNDGNIFNPGRWTREDSQGLFLVVVQIEYLTILFHEEGKGYASEGVSGKASKPTTGGTGLAAQSNEIPDIIIG